MKRIIGEYGMALLYSVIVIFFLSIGFHYFNNPNSPMKSLIPDPSAYQQSAGDNNAIQNPSKQPIFKVTSGSIAINSVFNPNDFVVEAKGPDGRNYKGTSAISYRGEVNTAVRGAYDIEILLTIRKDESKPAVENNVLFVIPRRTTIVVD